MTSLEEKLQAFPPKYAISCQFFETLLSPGKQNQRGPVLHYPPPHALEVIEIISDTQGVDFTNILLAAFMPGDPQSAKRHKQLDFLFALLDLHT